MLAGLPHSVGGFCDAHIISVTGANPRKGTSRGIPDFLSHDTDRWAFDLLQGGRPQRRADTSPAAWTSVFIADVRASLRPAFRSLYLVAPDYPGFGHSDWPDPKKFAYTFDHYAEIMNHFTEGLGLSRYTLYMQDYGGPVGFRMALAHPERIEALIVQDAVAHNEGLGANWKTRRAFWADRAANESALRTNLLSLATTRTRHVGNDPNVERYDPDLWTDEFAFLNQPGQADIQSDLFYDYRTNVDAYSKWQAWMRERQPRLLVIWGKYDLSFDVSEPEAYRRDVPNAEVHVLGAGHFALDTAADEIAALVRGFVGSSR
jgi:pimeloyl-ACP methyl ester carboxylesterase